MSIKYVVFEKHRRDSGVYPWKGPGIVEEQPPPWPARLSEPTWPCPAPVSSAKETGRALTRGSIAPSIASTNAMAAATADLLGEEGSFARSEIS